MLDSIPKRLSETALRFLSSEADFANLKSLISYSKIKVHSGLILPWGYKMASVRDNSEDICGVGNGINIAYGKQLALDTFCRSLSCITVAQLLSFRSR